jgi:hypothetical protein
VEGLECECEGDRVYTVKSDDEEGVILALKAVVEVAAGVGAGEEFLEEA